MSCGGWWGGGTGGTGGIGGIGGTSGGSGGGSGSGSGGGVFLLRKSQQCFGKRDRIHVGVGQGHHGGRTLAKNDDILDVLGGQFGRKGFVKFDRVGSDKLERRVGFDSSCDDDAALDVFVFVCVRGDFCLKTFGFYVSAAIFA